MATYDVRVSKKVFNPAYLGMLNNESRNEIFYGGSGSGKSVFIAQRMIYRHMMESGRNTVVIRKVARTNRISTFPLLKRVIYDWKVDPLFTVNDLRIRCHNKNEIIFAGLDDVEKIKSITFENGDLTDIWVEEASEMTQADYQQLNLRLRGIGKIPKQIALSFNPISSMSWLKSYFFDRIVENCNILKTTYKDNLFIDEEYKLELERLQEIDHIYYQVYALGEWGMMGNLILKNWTVAECPKDPLAYDAVLSGMDFGFNHPAALLRVGVKDDNLFVFQEVYERGLTNNEWIKVVGEEGIPKNQIITGDSAEPARIKEFRQAGFNVVPALKGSNSVKDGIDWLRRRHITVDPSCINTIGEMQTWKYREDKDGNVLEDPVPVNDDLMAALRYAVEALVVMNKIKAVSLKGFGM